MRADQAPKLIRAEQSGRATVHGPSLPSPEINPDDEPQTEHSADGATTHAALVGDENVEIADDAQSDSVNPDYVTTLDCVQILGVDLVTACRVASTFIRTPPPTIIEPHGRGRTNELANGRRKYLTCKGLGALDLRTHRPRP